jgi:hypothetical protein
MAQGKLKSAFSFAVPSWKFVLRGWKLFLLEEIPQTQKGAALARLTGIPGLTSSA